MRIENFQYHNKTLEWKLERVSFSDLTLLVGISGVGKTQILKALLAVKNIAEGKSLNGVSWDMEFSTAEGHKYKWSGEFEKKDLLQSEEFFFGEFDNDEREKFTILTERLIKDGEEVALRKAEDITFLGKKTPKLSSTSSIIYLLREEDIVQPASRAFRRIIYSDQSIERRFLIEWSLEKQALKYDTLKKIQESNLDTQIKIALVYKCHPEAFEKIKSRFLDIFPQVRDIKVEPLKNTNAPPFIANTPLIQIKEDGVSDWIKQDKISSGMIRTIIHIAEMYLWPDGTVILIDEFENSLGVNCIDVITEDLLQHNRRLQFIVTSHHPYIINNISAKYWKVVTRIGGTVTAHDASSIGLGESSHEAFIQLINSDIYRDGIEV